MAPFRLNEEALMPRLRLTAAAAMAAAALVASIAIPAAAAPAHGQPAHREGTGPEYYLSLGDSLSVGDQPNAQGVTLPTDQGYADQLYAALRGHDHDLRLAKLGCPGETTATLNGGGICGYAGDQRYSLTADTGSQLAAALAFLHAHRGHVPLITIDIGANDLNGCVALGSISAVAACAGPAIQAAGKNLAVTLGALRAADPQATIAGMSYYVPELAAWLTGASGQAFAEGAVQLGEGLNATLAVDFKAAGAPVADVFDAFKSTDFTDTVPLPGFGSVPENVALVCQWTWECAAPPVGPNEHANAAGYAIIAKAFLAVLPARRR
jgi:lysophospholipase L1-like esterase